MNLRTFNKTINALRAPKRVGHTRRLGLAKVQALPDDQKTVLVQTIVRHRGPVLTALLSPQTDRAWLAACGYFHRTISQRTGFEFVHTAEHVIR